MKRKQIAEKLAEEREIPLHLAADWLDSFLHELLKSIDAKPKPGDPQ